MPRDCPQRVTLPTLQILAAFMSDRSREDWYGRALSVHTGLVSGTVLQCLYRLGNWGWLESRWEDRDLATHDGRSPRRFYRLTGVGQREARALLAVRFKGQLRFAPGGGMDGLERGCKRALRRRPPPRTRSRLPAAHRAGGPGRRSGSRARPGAGPALVRCSADVDERPDVHRPATGQRVLGSDLDWACWR